MSVNVSAGTGEWNIGNSCDCGYGRCFSSSCSIFFVDLRASASSFDSCQCGYGPLLMVVRSSGIVMETTLIGFRHLPESALQVLEGY